MKRQTLIRWSIVVGVFLLVGLLSPVAARELAQPPRPTLTPMPTVEPTVPPFTPSPAPTDSPATATETPTTQPTITATIPDVATAQPTAGVPSAVPATVTPAEETTAMFASQLLACLQRCLRLPRQQCHQ